MGVGRRAHHSGSSPSAHTYAAPGAYTITLTTTDGWGKAASTTRNVNLVEPAGNTAPVPQFTSNCLSFTACTFTTGGTVDNQGDVIRYAWTFGDGATSASANPSRTYTSPGTYTVTLTTTDVWGKAAWVSHDVTITEPAGNNAPTAAIASGTCTTINTTCTMSSAGSSDPDTATGDGIRNYVWSWDNGLTDTVGTSANQSHVFPVPGTYAVTLTVLDKWGRASAPVTMDVTTAAEPAGNNGPTVVFNAPSCAGLTCTGVSERSLARVRSCRRAGEPGTRRCIEHDGRAACSGRLSRGGHVHGHRCAGTAPLVEHRQGDGVGARHREHVGLVGRRAHRVGRSSSQLHT